MVRKIEFDYLAPAGTPSTPGRAAIRLECPKIAADAGGAGLGADSCDLQPGRLWSLADVINSNISMLCALCSQLQLEEIRRKIHPEATVSAEELRDINGWLSIASKVADDFDMVGVRERIELIKRQIASGISHKRLSEEYRVLLETINYESKWHFIYRYPHDKAMVLTSWRDAWGPTLSAFPSAIVDVYASIDLWALGHSTAAVFHLMRVLEHGLRSLAANLGLTFDIQNWQNILDQIESEIRNQGKSLPRGSAKSERLRFLSEAAKEFHFFKDGWRNYVSHNRSVYDEHQARSVMDHVCSFMNGLASRLSEEPGP